MSGADPPQHVLRPPARKRTAEPEMEPASFTVEQIPRVGSLTRAEVEALRSGAIPDGWPSDRATLSDRQRFVVDALPTTHLARVRLGGPLPALSSSPMPHDAPALAALSATSAAAG